MNDKCTKWLNQFKVPGCKSINQSTRIYIAPYVAGESEARKCFEFKKKFTTDFMVQLGL